MSEKKNIDRIFQEKFRDFEFTPPESAWDTIRERLEEKKERRVIPLWLRLTGVAALLLIGFGIFSTFTGNPDMGNDSVVYDRQAPARGNNNIPAPGGRRIHSNETVADSPSENNSGSGSRSDNKNIRSERSGRKGYQKSPYPPASGNGSAFSAGAESVASQERAAASHKKSASGSRNHRRFVSPSPEHGVASGDGQRQRRQSKIGKNKTKASGSANPVPTPAIPENNAVAGSERASGRNATGIAGSQPGSSAIDRTLPVVPGQTSPENAVAETTVDTTAVKPENELEKLLQEKLNGEDKDKKEVADALQNRWALKPQVAPLYYSSLSNGSPIDAQFASNSKTYDNNLSYGLGVNYAVNERLRIRSGVNTVNLSYATNGIQFFASLSEQTSNVSTSKNANIVVQNSGPATGTGVGALAPDQLPQQKFNGEMVQKMGYIEVPMELSYSLVNRKFGIDLIGGVSTLFLNDNNIYVTSSQGYRAEVGEAENLNSVHFSTNVGVGFKYRFWKSFEANFEPTFKYQVNTFSGDAGNFKPYFIGLYSGISFSF